MNTIKINETFDKEFPSLVGKGIDEGYGGHSILIHKKNLSENCKDNQIINDAINNALKKPLEEFTDDKGNVHKLLSMKQDSRVRHFVELLKKELNLKL